MSLFSSSSSVHTPKLSLLPSLLRVLHPTATPLFQSPVLTAYISSFILLSRDLLVSPMYTQSQSWHGIWYTMSFLFFSGMGVFTLVNRCLSVPLDLKTARTPIFLQALWIFSDTLFKYGRCTATWASQWQVPLLLHQRQVLFWVVFSGFVQ